MYLSKTIVLVSLAAVMAAPSALALRPPIAHEAQTSTVCKEGPYGPYGCVAVGNSKKAHKTQTSTVCKEKEGPYGPYGCVAVGDPGTHSLTHEKRHSKKVHKTQTSTVCKEKEGPYGPYGCVALGF